MNGSVQDALIRFEGGTCLHIIQEERVVDVYRGFLDLGGSLAQSIPPLAQLTKTVTLGTQLAIQMNYFSGKDAIPAAHKEQLFSHVGQNLHTRKLR
jgi:hypothetical protein